MNNYFFKIIILINPMASPCERAPALKYGDVNTVTPSPGEVKGLRIKILLKRIFGNNNIRNI